MLCMLMRVLTLPLLAQHESVTSPLRPGAHAGGGTRGDDKGAHVARGEMQEIKEVGDESVEESVEERNKYAVSILRRVKQKMDGRDRIDSFGIAGGGGSGSAGAGVGGGKMTVQEQVDMTIKDATNIEKLCEMYEGWTPWV